MAVQIELERIMASRRVGDHFWSFLMGLLVGVPTGVFSGVLLVAVLGSDI